MLRSSIFHISITLCNGSSASVSWNTSDSQVLKINYVLKHLVKMVSEIRNFCSCKSALKYLGLYFPLRVSSVMLQGFNGFKQG